MFSNPISNKIVNGVLVLIDKLNGIEKLESR